MAIDAGMARRDARDCGGDRADAPAAAAGLPECSRFWRSALFDVETELDRAPIAARPCASVRCQHLSPGIRNTRLLGCDVVARARRRAAALARRVGADRLYRTLAHHVC